MGETDRVDRRSSAIADEEAVLLRLRFQRLAFERRAAMAGLGWRSG